MPSGRRARSRPRLFLRKVKRQRPQILVLEAENVEGVELDLVVMFARMQTVEIRDAVDAEQLQPSKSCR